MMFSLLISSSMMRPKSEMLFFAVRAFCLKPSINSRRNCLGSFLAQSLDSTT